jgi:PadR family transcriptional regulator, regulatory protein PadR
LTFDTSEIIFVSTFCRSGVVAHQSELLRGTLDLLILKALSLGPLHGLGVARRVEQITGGTFQVKPGSLFPALHRLEEKGWLGSEWGVSESNRRAKYYTLTKAGRSQFQQEVKSWGRVAFAINRSLEATS